MTNENVLGVPVEQVVAAARDLANAGRWRRALDLLDASVATTARDRALLAVTAADVAVEVDWRRRTQTAGARLDAADALLTGTAVDPAPRWDLDFARLRHEYAGTLVVDGAFRPGPGGKDPAAVAALRRRAEELGASAPDDVRQGWARMYLGLVLENLCAERAAAPAHYAAALSAGDRGDDLLAREALRHLGDHDHDAGDHERAHHRWTRATSLGARAGAVPGTLAQLLLLAVLSRDTGDEAGAVMLAGEVARWAGALGAVSIEDQARAFVDGVDPTALPPDAP